MQSLKRALGSFGEHIASLGLWLAAAALLIIVALNGFNIVLRYFFLDALSWAEEAMNYLMVFSVYAGAVSVAWRQAHIRIDALLNFAPLRYRRIANVASTLIAVAILIPVTIASYDVVRQLFQFDQRSDAMHLPMWIPQSVVPAALLLIILMSLARIWLYEPVQDSAEAQLAETENL
jgi:C4-dicarboxylate transporter DctQ subunit